MHCDVLQASAAIKLNKLSLALRCAVVYDSNFNPAEVLEGVFNHHRVGHAVPEEGPQGLDVEQRLDPRVLVVEDLALRPHLLLYLDKYCARRTTPSRYQMQFICVHVVTEKPYQDLRKLLRGSENSESHTVR